MHDAYIFENFSGIVFFMIILDCMKPKKICKKIKFHKTNNIREKAAL